MEDAKDPRPDDLTELRARIDRYQMMTRAACDLIWDWDLPTGRIEWDLGFAGSFGYSLGEIEASIDWWKCRVHPEDLPHVWKKIEGAWESGRSIFDTRYRFFAKDGSISYVWDRGYTQRDKQGNAVRMIGAMQDITQQRLAEERLRKSEAKFRHIYESNMLGVIYWNLDGDITDANDSFLKSTGYTREDLEQGRIDWLAMTPPEYMEQERRSVEEVRSRGYCAPFEKEYIRKDGTRFPIMIAGAMLEGEHGGLAFVVDLSERKKADESFRRLADAIPQIVWITNEATSELEYLNEHWMKYTGMSLEETRTGSALDPVHPNDREKVIREWERARKSGVAMEAEMRIRRASDGTYRTHLARSIPMRDENGRVLRWFGTNTDIEDWKVAQHTLSEQKAKMIASAKLSALGEMAGGIAHEVNNPLAVIHGRAGQLRKLAETGQCDAALVAKFATMIESTASRISRTVQSLKNIARDGTKEPFRPYSLSAIIQETVELCRERFRHNGVELIIDPVREELLVECRSIQISQVLLNLLNNAYDAVEGCAKKWIRISCEERNGDAIISVIDSGRGIPIEIREKIMQPFFTTKEIGRGTGLGLSVSKGIIEAHRGQLWLDEEGSHTRFWIRLPKKQAR